MTYDPEHQKAWRERPEVRARRKEYMRTYFKNHPEAHARKTAKRYALIRALVWELKNVPCADCGVRYPPYVMDFDHRDPKTKSDGMGKLMGRGVSRDRILAEAAKCDVVCANCHRVRTFAPRSRDVAGAA